MKFKEETTGDIIAIAKDDTLINLTTSTLVILLEYHRCILQILECNLNKNNRNIVLHYLMILTYEYPYVSTEIQLVTFSVVVLFGHWL